MHKKEGEKMEVMTKIVELLKEAGKSQTDLMEYLNINRNVFTDWKAGRNHSYRKHLPKIAEFFGVSVDFLLGKTAEKEKAAEPGGLSPVDARLLSLFHSLNAEGQARAVETLEDMVAGGRYKKDSARVG